MMILVVGPLLEEKYGSSSILLAIATTALVTGLANFILFPQKQLLGASGVVFALILLSSFTCVREGGDSPDLYSGGGDLYRAAGI